MKIGFRDTTTALLFNDYAELEARFGAEPAEKIASRMGILSVAKNLGCLPSRAPIGFSCDDAANQLFGVDAGPMHRLQFRAVVAKGRRKKAASNQIEEIIVSGVVEIRRG